MKFHDISTAPGKRKGEYYAWRPSEQAWTKVYTFFEGLDGTPEVVCNASSGKIWRAKWWMPLLPSPEHASDPTP